MDQDIREKFENQEAKLDSVHKSLEKIRMYFMISLIMNVAFIVLPLIGLLFVIPQFLSTIEIGL